MQYKQLEAARNTSVSESEQIRGCIERVKVCSCVKKRAHGNKTQVLFAQVQGTTLVSINA